jgi:hypothetical protein
MEEELSRVIEELEKLNTHNHDLSVREVENTLTKVIWKLVRYRRFGFKRSLNKEEIK